MKKFVAISDDMLDKQPHVVGRLVPYQCDYPCQRLYRQPIDEVSGLIPLQLSLVLPQEGKSNDSI
ncbi:MAG: hypothetical protein COA75_13670 [Cellvibrionales bacterium]|nr:MAG: hypothetical protein COA75_13670 [Cellvibrionales bacterium]